VAEALRCYRTDPVPDVGADAADDPDLTGAYAGVSRGHVELGHGLIAEAQAVWQRASPDQSAGLTRT
jgi:hypothetical protein